MLVRWKQIVVVLLIAMAIGRGVASAQSAQLAVIVGLAGDPEFGELYSKWGASLVDAATKRFGIPKAQVQYLHEKPETDPARATGKSTRDEVVKAFGKLAAAGAEDVVFVVLIGHGTFDGKVAKFNLPGPDMTAGGLRAAGQAAGAAAGRVREHGERERAVHRGAVRAGTDDRDRDPQRA